MACENCGCDCETDKTYEGPERIDYMAISPEDAGKQIEALVANPHPMARLDARFHTPRFWAGKSHLAGLMARRDGQEVTVIDITNDPVDQ